MCIIILGVNPCQKLNSLVETNIGFVETDAIVNETVETEQGLYCIVIKVGEQYYLFPAVR